MLNDVPFKDLEDLNLQRNEDNAVLLASSNQRRDNTTVAGFNWKEHYFVDLNLISCFCWPSVCRRMDR